MSRGPWSDHIEAWTEGRRLRSTDIEFAGDLNRLVGAPAIVTPAIVCKTVAVGTYPTVAGRYYAVRPISLFGDEVEGATPAVADSGPGHFFAVHLGTNVPPVGTRVFVVATPEGRRAFRH